MTAGAAAYVFILNRLLIQVRDRRFKSLMVRAGGLSAAGIGALIGWLSAGSRWSALPVATLVVTCIGEIRRLALRHDIAAARPWPRMGRGQRSLPAQHDDRPGGEALRG